MKKMVDDFPEDMLRKWMIESGLQIAGLIGRISSFPAEKRLAP